MKSEQSVLVDPGFDSDFDLDRIEEICTVFGSEDRFQELVYKIHAESNALDMKRGEFYPEILRAIKSMKAAIAKAYGVDPKQCHPNFGCNGSIDTILTAMKLREISQGVASDREGGMLVATPTYFRNYNSSEAKQIRMVQVPLLEPSWQVDLPQFLELMTKRQPTVVFLVTPNNPTGIALSDDAILQILESCPDKTLVVMDRTLVNIDSEISTEELLASFQHKQLAILHSCSKYCGLSHLRTGYAIYSNVDLAEEMRPHLPLGLGLEGALKATRLLLKHGPLRPTNKVLEYVRSSKSTLVDFCSRSRFGCTDFVGNYCLLLLPNDLDSETVVRDVKAKGIYVMGGHEFPDKDVRRDVVRLHTGGKPEFMQRTVETLESLYR